MTTKEVQSRTGRLFAGFGAHPERAWAVLLLVLLIFFVALPLIDIVRTTVIFGAEAPRMVHGAKPGDMTLHYWLRVLSGRLSSSLFYGPALHSLLIAIGMTAIAMVFGTLAAWLIARSDVPLKRFFSLLLIIPYVVPSWTVALAWITVFKTQRFGGTPGLLSSLFKFQAPDWLAFGPLPIIISLGVHYIPYTFIIVRGILANIDSRLEESAELVGAGRLRVLMRILLPMALPALGSAFILTFSKGLGEFATQAFLGLPVRYYTLSTRVYSALNNRLYGEGYTLALILILITSLVVWGDQALIGTRKRFTTIEGKGSRRKPFALRGWRMPVLALLLLFVVIFVFGPILLLLWTSLMRTEGNYSFDNLTLHYWFGTGILSLADGQAGVFRNPVILSAIKNSVLLAVSTGLLAGIVGMLLGYTVVRNRGRWIARGVELLSFAPYMIPGIAFGGIYLSMFARKLGPLPALYGTFALLVITCLVKDLPFASSSGATAIHQIDPSLEEAATVHGIPWRTRFARIVVPLAKSGFLSAMLLTFITTMRVLDVIILLVTPKTTLMTAVVFRYQQQDFVQHAYGVMLIIVFIIISVHALLQRLGGKIEL